MSREFILDHAFPAKYQNAKPFPSIVIDDFLTNEKASRLEEALLGIKPTSDWYSYDNLFEKKIATDRFPLMPVPVREMLLQLNGQECISYLEEMTGIEGLIADSTLRGGGLHLIPTGGFLDLHSDRSFHPTLKLYRRINLLIYLNRSYRPEYGGQLELWDKEITKCEKMIEPIFNRAVIFSTDANSFHGHTNPWKSLRPRVSIAAYFYTATVPEGFKANMESTDFRAKPTDPIDPVKDKLREDRKNLRLKG